MNRLTRLFPLVAILLLVASCATSSLGKFSQTQDAFIAALDVALSARDSGTISEEKWQREFVPVINGLNSLMRIYEDQARNGRVTEQTISSVANLLRQLNSLIQGVNS